VTSPAASLGGEPGSSKPGGTRIRAITVAVLLGSVVLAAVLSYGVWRLNARTEDRLLSQQARQAGALISASLDTTRTPLVAAADSARVAGPAAFVSVLSPYVGPGRRFVGAALWVAGASSPVAVLGTPQLVNASPAVLSEFGRRAAAAPQLSVTPMLASSNPRVGYAYTEMASPRYIAYAETALPADRTQVPRRNTAYRNVNYALYVGGQQQSANLVAASTAHLPLAGRRASVVTPFGDTSVLLVMTPRSNLGGWLSGNLWWILLVGGLLLGLAAAVLVDRLAHRRDEAEGLVREVSRLYEEQRGIAVTLQRALLPENMPVLDGLEIATRYVPASSHSEVGGDWFDVIPVGDHEVIVIVGDVSGHGIAAATAMASLRFAARAFVSEGNAPAQVLGKLDKILDIRRDGQFATVACASLDLRNGRLRVANAGHPDMILVDGAGGRLLGSQAGPPVGVQETPPTELECVLPSGATLLAFTDGLFERRGESLDVGLQRVCDCVAGIDGTVDAILGQAIADVVPSDHPDDIAMVGLRWTPAATARGAA